MRDFHFWLFGAGGISYEALIQALLVLGVVLAVVYIIGLDLIENMPMRGFVAFAWLLLVIIAMMSTFMTVLAIAMIAVDTVNWLLASPPIHF